MLSEEPTPLTAVDELLATATTLLAAQGWQPATTDGRPSRLDEPVDHGHFILRDAGQHAHAPLELTATASDYWLDLHHMGECLQDGGLTLVDLAMADTIGLRAAAAGEIAARACSKLSSAVSLLAALAPRAHHPTTAIPAAADTLF